MSLRFKVVLTLMALTSAVSLILAGWALYSRFDQADTFRTQTRERQKADRALARQNQAAVRELCGQGKTLKDVVIGGIAVVYAELQDPNVPERTHSADRMFLKRFRGDLGALNFLLNNPRSACQRVAP